MDELTEAANEADPAPAPATFAEHCLPLPEPFPACDKCGNGLTMAVSPWPSGGMLLRWLCFDATPRADDGRRCCDQPLREGPMPGLVPHPQSRVLVTRTELLAWFAELDGAASEILASTRQSRRQAIRRVEPAVRRIAAVLDELAPRIDPALVPAQLEAVPEPTGLAVVRDEPDPRGLLLHEGCPVCGALDAGDPDRDGAPLDSDQPCRTSSGAKAKRPHAGRDVRRTP